MLLAAVALTALSALRAAESDTPPRPPLDLSWAASPGCASADEVQAEVARLLTAATGNERAVRAFATLAARENAALEVDLRIEIAGESHQRRFEAESCQAAKSAIALILALAVNPAAAKTFGASDPQAVSASPGHDPASSTPPSPSTTVSEAAKPDTRERRPAARTQASRESSALSLGASGLADIGTLPSVSPGGELQLVYQLGQLRLEGAAALLGAQDASDPTSDAYATFSAVSGHLRLGYGAQLGGVWAGPFGCVGLMQLHASGHRGSVDNFDRNETVPELGAGGLVSFRAAGPLGVRLSAEGLVPTRRPRFVVDEPAPPNQLLSRSSSVVVRVTLGVTIQFL